MKFPWRSRDEIGAAKPEEEGPDPGPHTECHRSPGLFEALASLRSDRRCSVLDLGPAVADNVAFFSENASRLQIVDLLRPGETGDPTSGAMRALHDLESTLGPTFDLVLAWDVLDYFPKNQAATLVDLLGRLCRPDARLHLIVSGKDTMPARPTRHRIVDAENLVYEQTTREETGSPNQTPAMVGKTLDGFRIEHSFVLRHGVHEYVAARKGQVVLPLDQNF